MEPPFPNNSSHNSKDEQASASTSGFMKPQVSGASPMIKQPPKMPKNKGIISIDVIDVDDDDDVIDVEKYEHDKILTNDKGKGIYHHSDHQLKKTLGSHSFSPDVEILESANGVESSIPSTSHNVIDLDNYSSGSSAEMDEWIPYDEIMDVDEYSALQAHFDHMDIPPDIEAPIPWLPHDQNGNNTNIKTSSFLAEPQIKPVSVNELGKSPAHVELEAAIANSLNFSNETDFLNHLPQSIESFASFISQDIQPNKKSAASHYRHKSVSPHEVSHLNNSLLGIDATKSRWYDPFKRKKKLHGSNNVSINQLDAMKLHYGGETSATSNSIKKQVGPHSTSHSNFPTYVNFFKHPEAGTSFLPHWPEFSKMKTNGPVFAPNMASSGPYDPFNPLVPPTLGEVNMPWIQGYTQNLPERAPDDSISKTISPQELEEILGNFERFKQFDTIDDHSDHHYTTSGSSMKQASKKWTKKVQEDWKILENDLPETIFVRVYESRMDLMRAVIIGAEGTPYHDGLFFFDIFFPPGYPDVPPKVHYHSGGLRLNPNLYNCGKVCLSLLNTWAGSGNEKWIPGMSTMLQILVSIQGLILNTKPYFNEPGYASQSGSAVGEDKSQKYNEDTFILSIKTMVYSMRKPPKYFEDFVRGHFFKRAHDILVACKAYIEGAQVGSLVKGGVQDLDMGSKSCSKPFQQSLNQVLSMLVEAFKKLGVSDCEKFLSLRPMAVSNARKRVGKHSKAHLESVEGDGAKKLVLG